MVISNPCIVVYSTQSIPLCKVIIYFVRKLSILSVSDYSRTETAFAVIALLLMLIGHVFVFYSLREPRYMFKRLTALMHFMTGKYSSKTFRSELLKTKNSWPSFVQIFILFKGTGLRRVLSTTKSPWNFFAKVSNNTECKDVIFPAKGLNSTIFILYAKYPMHCHGCRTRYLWF